MTGTNRLNSTAIDLWRQMFDRAAADPHSTLVDPNHDDSIDEARFREGLCAAGWSDGEAEILLRNQRAQVAQAPVTSPGISPHVELRHAMLCDAIEAGMDRLRLASQAKVARGIEPRIGLTATKTGVIMTDQSIVTVGAFLFRFCGIVAKAFARTLYLGSDRWESDDYTPDAGRALLCTNPPLVRYWLDIHLSFAISGTHIGVPFLPARKEEIVLVEEVARAMEIFAVAHEYGHHHFGHGRDIGDAAWPQEFEADQFALRLSAEVDRGRGGLEGIENPYLTSGAGGLILLRALETQRAIAACLGERQSASDSHPPTLDRIEQFDSVQLLFPDEFRRLKGFRTVADRIMASIAALLSSGLSDLSREQVGQFHALRHQMRGE